MQHITRAEEVEMSEIINVQQGSCAKIVISHVAIDRQIYGVLKAIKSLVPICALITSTKLIVPPYFFTFWPLLIENTA